MMFPRRASRLTRSSHAHFDAIFASMRPMRKFTRAYGPTGGSSRNELRRAAKTFRIIMQMALRVLRVSALRLCRAATVGTGRFNQMVCPNLSSLRRPWRISFRSSGIEKFPRSPRSSGGPGPHGALRSPRCRRTRRKSTEPRRPWSFPALPVSWFQRTSQVPVCQQVTARDAEASSPPSC